MVWRKIRYEMRFGEKSGVFGEKSGILEENPPSILIICMAVLILLSVPKKSNHVYIPNYFDLNTPAESNMHGAIVPSHLSFSGPNSP
jgi:hypothetical protein